MADNEVLIDIAGLKKDVENVNQIHNRLDTAIDRLTDVSTSIKSMLAVHEEKITRQEKIDEVIFGEPLVSPCHGLLRISQRTARCGTVRKLAAYRARPGSPRVLAGMAAGSGSGKETS